MNELMNIENDFNIEMEFQQKRVKLLDKSIAKAVVLRDELVNAMNDHSLTRKEVDKKCLNISQKIFFLSTIPMINEN